MRLVVITYTLDVMLVLSWSLWDWGSPRRICELPETMWNGGGVQRGGVAVEEGPQLSVHLFSKAYDLRSLSYAVEKGVCLSSCLTVFRGE